MKLSLIAGLIYGLGIYMVNMYVITFIFPWFSAVRDWITAVTHAVFGLSLAGTYKMLSDQTPGILTRRGGGIGFASFSLTAVLEPDYFRSSFRITLAFWSRPLQSGPLLPWHGSLLCPPYVVSMPAPGEHSASRLFLQWQSWCWRWRLRRLLLRQR